MIFFIIGYFIDFFFIYISYTFPSLCQYLLTVFDFDPNKPLKSAKLLLLKKAGQFSGFFVSINMS